MTNRKSKWLAVLVASVLVSGFIVSLPSAASADVFSEVTLQPVGATYELNDVATPLRAEFLIGNTDDVPNPKYDYVSGETVTITWFMNDDNSYSGVEVRKTDIAYSEGEGVFECSDEYTPSTAIAGTQYYYAVLSYSTDIEEDIVAYVPLEAQGVTLQTDIAEIIVRDADPEPLISEVLEVPFTKIVEQGGTAAPGAQTFTFAVGFRLSIGEEEIREEAAGEEETSPFRFVYEPEELAAAGIVVTGNTIDTNGVGSYNGTLIVTVSNEATLADIDEFGFFVWEVDEKAANWQYSDVVWWIVVIDDMDDVDLSDLQEVMLFTNVYTANVPVEPLATPSTGDIAMVSLGLALLCSATGSATVFVSRRRKNRS